MSALPKAAISEHLQCLLCAKSDILQCGRKNWRYSITSSARDSSDCGAKRPSAFAVCGTIFDAKPQAEGA
jgi:hypothetical protein